MATFKIYGDYGYTTETLIEEFSSLDEATRFAKRYTKFGDLGGYDQIEVASFAKDGEYRTHWRLAKEGY